MDDNSGRNSRVFELRSRERVLRAVGRQPVDRPPMGELCIDDALVGRVLGRTEVGFSCRREFLEILGLDLICIPPPSMSLEDLMSDRPPPAPSEWIDLERWRTESGAFVFAMLNGGFFWANVAMGFQDFIIALYRGDESVKTVFRKAAEVNARLARSAVERGAQACLLADDIAYNGGTYVPVSMMDDRYFPTIGSLLGEMKDCDVPVFLHSDGDLRKVLHSIVGAGFAGLQGLEEAAGMDLAAVKREYGSQICLWGNLDPMHLVHSTDREEIERQVRRVMTAGSPGGGFIFGTSSGLFAQMRPESVRRAYEAARQFRHAGREFSQRPVS